MDEIELICIQFDALNPRRQALIEHNLLRDMGTSYLFEKPIIEINVSQIFECDIKALIKYSDFLKLEKYQKEHKPGNMKIILEYEDK